VQHTGRECGIVISFIVQRASRNSAALSGTRFSSKSLRAEKFAASGDFAWQSSS
jgi:hypothetical protein